VWGPGALSRGTGGVGQKGREPLLGMGGRIRGKGAAVAILFGVGRGCSGNTVWHRQGRSASTFGSGGGIRVGGAAGAVLYDIRALSREDGFLYRVLGRGGGKRRAGAAGTAKTCRN
jgi:hypothetical protein